MQDLLRECVRLLQDLLWDMSIRCGVFEWARSRRVPEPVSCCSMATKEAAGFTTTSHKIRDLDRVHVVSHFQKHKSTTVDVKDWKRSFRG